MSEVRVKGLADLNRFLQQLPAKVEANVLRGALKAGAQVISDAAKANVPVDTGRLRDSIRVSVRLRRGRVIASIKAGGPTKKRIGSKKSGGIKVMYDNAYYATWVEYGTAAHKIAAKYAKALVLRPNKRATLGVAKRWMRGELIVEGVDHPGSKPRPYMRPAMHNKAGAAVMAAAEYMRKRLASKHGLTAAADVELEAA